MSRHRLESDDHDGDVIRRELVESVFKEEFRHLLRVGLITDEIDGLLILGNIPELRNTNMVNITKTKTKNNQRNSESDAPHHKQ
jgi:hypothetical protein